MTQKNIKWHMGEISYKHRCQLLKQKGTVIWLTGLSGSGKSTIAVELEKILYERGFLAYRLDGDNIRHHLNQDLGFSDHDRRENVRRIASVARLLCDAGIITIVACISPCHFMRQSAKESIGEQYFIEVFVKASIESCRKRDPKNLYQKVKLKKIKQFTGIDAYYIPPEQPTIIIDTEKLSPLEARDQLLQYLIQQNVI